MRRVVITGLGIVSPLGVGVDFVWNRLLRGESGVVPISRFPVSNLPSKIAAQVPFGKEGESVEGHFYPELFMSSLDFSRVDEYICYAVAAAQEALADAGWSPATADSIEPSLRTGVLIGSAVGGLHGISKTALTFQEKGLRGVSPFFIPGRLVNLASGYVAMYNKLRGPNHAVATACATGTHAIGDAGRIIAMGDADVMLAGGAESSICPIGIAGFSACKALSTSFNAFPEKASRPFDRLRDGFVMGEGAGVLVLEEYEHALVRGASIYAEIAGYGLSGDAYHITAPDPSGSGAIRCMRGALASAGISSANLDYINAHGTSTPTGDQMEIQAVEEILKEDSAVSNSVSMSSTKSSVGHLLGAAGAVEAIFSVLSIRDQVVPPTLNLDDCPFDLKKVDLVAHRSKKRKIEFALSNSFGFGGTNASLLFRKIS